MIDNNMPRLKTVDGRPQTRVCITCRHQEYDGDRIDIKTWLRTHIGKGHICNSPQSESIESLPQEINCNHWKAQP